MTGSLEQFLRRKEWYQVRRENMQAARDAGDQTELDRIAVAHRQTNRETRPLGRRQWPPIHDGVIRGN